ncbi:MAG: FlgD immunoglobulin-like domain containing protein [Candidatus Neomarinimicrobiota bacterium]
MKKYSLLLALFLFAGLPQKMSAFVTMMMPNALEIFLNTDYIDPQDTKTFVVYSEVAIWDDDYKLTDNYGEPLIWGVPEDLATNPSNGWDFCTTNPPVDGIWETLGFTLYKFHVSTSLDEYFYLDYRDDNYSTAGYGSIDIRLKYVEVANDPDQWFYKDASGGVDNWHLITYEDTIGIWDIKLGAPGSSPCTDLFEPTPPAGTQIDVVGGNPKFSWDAVTEPPWTSIVYQVWRKINTGAWGIVSQSQTALYYTDTSQKAACDVYTYKVRAKTSQYSDMSETESYTEPGSTNTPTNLSIGTSGRWGNPVISWSHTGGPAGVKYRVQRKEGADGTYIVFADNLTAKTVTDTDVQRIRYPGETITFYYRALAFIPCYTSSYSSSASVVGGYEHWPPKMMPEDSNILPKSYALYSAHPNPFNPATTIGYGLPEASRVSLVIYDITGREVYTHAAAEDAGYRQIVWQGADRGGRQAPAGVYIYRLVAASMESSQRFTASRKMVLMK